jgi:hypothetical protein
VPAQTFLWQETNPEEAVLKSMEESESQK